VTDRAPATEQQDEDGDAAERSDADKWGQEVPARPRRRHRLSESRRADEVGVTTTSRAAASVCGSALGACNPNSTVIDVETLFDTLPPGFLLVPELLSTDEETALLSRLATLRFDPIVLHGRRARRTARHYGRDYDYARRVPSAGEALPPWLDEIRRHVAPLAKVAPEELAEALVQHYPEGSTIGWHRDAPAFDIVVGISLRGRCRMRFRRIGSSESREAVMQPRSAYILRDEVRWEWQHSIPPTQQERYSITFRTLRTTKQRP
jgi:alkylated DNA repair protein (DNA oxidative demethylase)